MRTSVFAVSLLALSVGAVEAQELKKGNLVGMHVSTIKLAAGVTMEKFTAFIVEKAFPRTRRPGPAGGTTRSGESGVRRRKALG